MSANHKPWLWPDHNIGKRESRALREEHNRTANAFDATLRALEATAERMEATAAKCNAQGFVGLADTHSDYAKGLRQIIREGRA